MINCPTAVCFYSHGAHTVWMTALMAESAWHVVACGLWLYIYYSLSLESLELLLSFSLGAPYVLLPFVTTCCHCTLSLDAVTHTCTFNVRLNTDSCFSLSRLWLCTFTLSVAVCAVLLLPISILSNEVLLTFPHSYYMQWLNGSLIHGNNQCSHTRHPIQRSSRLQRMSLCL